MVLVYGDNILTHDESVQWHKKVQSSKKRVTRIIDEIEKIQKIFRFEEYGSTLFATFG